MPKSKATVKVVKTTTKAKAKTSKKSGGNKNQKRCPSCGRYM